MIPPDAGRLWSIGQNGYNWALRAMSIHTDGTGYLSAYDLKIDANIVYPSEGPSYRFYGLPLRCLSTVLGM